MTGCRKDGASCDVEPCHAVDAAIGVHDSRLRVARNPRRARRVGDVDDWRIREPLETRPIDERRHRQTHATELVDGELTDARNGSELEVVDSPIDSRYGHTESIEVRSEGDS